MATLIDLALITGHKSISDMTDEELQEHLRLVRQSRRTPKASSKKASGSTETKKAKAKAPAQAMPDISNLTPEQALEMLKKLGGKG